MKKLILIETSENKEILVEELINAMNTLIGYNLAERKSSNTISLNNSEIIISDIDHITNLIITEDKNVDTLCILTQVTAKRLHDFHVSMKEIADVKNILVIVEDRFKISKINNIENLKMIENILFNSEIDIDFIKKENYVGSLKIIDREYK